MRRLVDADKLMDGLGRLAVDTDLCKRYGNCTPWIPYSAVRKLISDMILEAKESCDDAVSRQVATNVIKKRLFETAFNNVGIKQNVDETLSDVAENRLETWFGDVPSIQPEIIRCKDCKWCVEDYDTDGNVPYWICKNWDAGTDADGFCHEAERREMAE